MDRVAAVAGECGFLDGLPDFRPTEAYGYLPRNKVVALLTGSQGEPRAALARIADDQHPDVTLSPGDQVILSSRTIPGNERAVGKIINNLVLRGIDVITDRHKLVHVSGHPRRDELKSMYEWVRPQLAIPAHGEPVHLYEHAAFAKEQGVPQVLIAKNGNVVRLAPGMANIIEDVPVGRLFKDGDIVIHESDSAVPERRKLSFAGVVSVAFALDSKGDIIADPEFEIMGLPTETRHKRAMLDVVGDAVEEVLSTLPRAKRRDPQVVEEAVKRGVRSAVQNVWGKKPACHVLVVMV
jgi:ribonuclease J